MYEILCLITSKIEEKDTSLIADKIEETVRSLKGILAYKKNLGEKRLAYPIKHERRAYYFLAHFELFPEDLKKLEEKLKNMSEVLRFQITKIKDIKKVPEPPLEVEEKNKEKMPEEEIDKILEDNLI